MKTKQLCYISLMSVLIAAGAFIKLPLGIIPITMQTLFVFLACYVLKEKAYLSVLLYIAIGLLGLPVFASGGGIAYVLVPSFGYLIGFLICALYLGYVQPSSYKSMIGHSIIGLLIIYLCGMTYFYGLQTFYYGQSITFAWMFQFLFLAFVPGDGLAMILGIVIYKRLENTSVMKSS